MSFELLPCPFCNMQPSRHRRFGSFFFRCLNPECTYLKLNRDNFSSGLGRTEIDAILRWNSDVEETPLLPPEPEFAGRHILTARNGERAYCDRRSCKWCSKETVNS